jgi:predicted RNase H-like nuclease
MEDDQDAIQQELERSLARPVMTFQLTHEIATLLRSLPRKVDPSVAARRLAENFAARFTYKSEKLQRLIKYRAKELVSLDQEAANLAADEEWDKIKKDTSSDDRVTEEAPP